MTGSATIGSTRGADAAADILAEPSCIRPVLMIPGGVLRPVRAMDQPAITDLLHDADVRRYLCDDRVLPAEAITAIVHADSQDAERGLGRWMIETANGVTLGLAGLCLVRGAGGRAPYLPGVVEPVIALYPHLWGQGLAAAALRALITHARDGLRLDRLATGSAGRRRGPAERAVSSADATPWLCAGRHHPRTRARTSDSCSRTLRSPA